MSLAALEETLKPEVFERFDEIAKRNPFFAQIYYTNHDKTEDNFYDERCFEDIL